MLWAAARPHSGFAQCWCREHPFSWQVLVAPHGLAEWSELDFEAVLCGCLLMKVNPSAFKAYPDVFRPVKHILWAGAGFEDLEETLLNALQAGSFLLCSRGHRRESLFRWGVLKMSNHHDELGAQNGERAEFLTTLLCTTCS